MLKFVIDQAYLSYGIGSHGGLRGCACEDRQYVHLGLDEYRKLGTALQGPTPGNRAVIAKEHSLEHACSPVLGHLTVTAGSFSLERLGGQPTVT